MELIQNKYKRRGLIGTLLFHGLLLLLLIIWGLTTPLPLPEEEGILISFGNTTTGMGEIQPSESSPASAAAPSVPEVKETPVLTQEHEESITIPKKEEVKPKPKPVEKPKVTPKEPVKTNTPKPTEKPKETVKEEPKVNPNAMYPGKQNTSSSSTSQGTTGTPGDQGDPKGSNTTAGTGLGSTGVSHNLGKDFGLYHALPKPKDNCNATVIINVLVDRNGRITNHNFNSGSRGTCALKMYEEIVIPSINNNNLRFTLKNTNIEEGRGTITIIFQSN